MAKLKIYCADDDDTIIEIKGDTFSGISLRDMSMHRAMLFEKDLSKSDFTGANLRCAYLEWANLSQAIFENANLITAHLRNAHLRESILVNCRLIGSRLNNANLIGADLTGANVRGVTFKGANFIRAICKFVHYDSADFEGAIYDDSTVWPEGFDPESRGLIRVSNRDGVEGYHASIAYKNKVKD